MKDLNKFTQLAAKLREQKPVGEVFLSCLAFADDEETAEKQREVFNELPNGTPLYTTPATESADAIDQLIARVRELEKEAVRYQWLRDNCTKWSWQPSKYNEDTVSGFAAFNRGYLGYRFEEAVDAARGDT